MSIKSKTLTKESTDAELAAVFAKQVAYKHSAMSDMACAILKAALLRNGDGVWPDSPEIVSAVQKLGKDDRNIVGSAWKWCLNLGLLSRGGARRRSTAGPSKGREIAEWHIAKRSAAETFCRRNAETFTAGQKELF